MMSTAAIPVAVVAEVSQGQKSPQHICSVRSSGAVCVCLCFCASGIQHIGVCASVPLRIDVLVPCCSCFGTSAAVGLGGAPWPMGGASVADEDGGRSPRGVGAFFDFDDLEEQYDRARQRPSSPGGGIVAGHNDVPPPSDGASAAIAPAAVCGCDPSPPELFAPPVVEAPSGAAPGRTRPALRGPAWGSRGVRAEGCESASHSVFPEPKSASPHPHFGPCVRSAPPPPSLPMPLQGSAAPLSPPPPAALPRAAAEVAACSGSLPRRLCLVTESSAWDDTRQDLCFLPPVVGGPARHELRLRLGGTPGVSSRSMSIRRRSGPLQKPFAEAGASREDPCAMDGHSRCACTALLFVGSQSVGRLRLAGVTPCPDVARCSSASHARSMT